MTKGVVENYKSEKKALDKLLVSKEAEAILEANKSDRDNANKEKAKAFEELSAAQKNTKRRRTTWPLLKKNTTKSMTCL